MYSQITISYRKWKKYYKNYLQMESFDRWLELALSDDFFIERKKRREYICVISYISDNLMEEGLLIKGIYTLKLPFNSSDLVSLVKRTDILEIIYDKNLSLIERENEKENIYKLIRLYSAFLDFRALNPSEKNGYDKYEMLDIIPESISSRNKSHFVTSQVVILGLILFTVMLSWFFIDNLLYKILITLLGIVSVLFDIFFVMKKYYIISLERDLEEKNFIRVTANVTDVTWKKSKILGAKRLAIIEFTTPNNTTSERFYLYTFSSSPPKAEGNKFIPITFLYNHNLVVDGPFPVYFSENKNKKTIDSQDFK